jgi:hypothetical protein
MPETVFWRNKMISSAITKCGPQIAHFSNSEYGITSLVTQISSGYAVTLFDDDANLMVEDVTIYPLHMKDQAMQYAKKLVAVPA